MATADASIQTHRIRILYIYIYTYIYNKNDNNNNKSLVQHRQKRFLALSRRTLCRGLALSLCIGQSSLCVSSPGTGICIGTRRSLALCVPRRSVSGPGSLCRSPEVLSGRLLRRAPALSVSEPGALCIKPVAWRSLAAPRCSPDSGLHVRLHAGAQLVISA